MEPMQILLPSLGLAATHAVQSLANRAVNDSYDRLRKLIVGRFGARQPKLVSILTSHAKAPDSQRAVTEKALRDAGADRDQEVIDQATQLLKLLEDARPEITGGLVSQINAQGGKVVVISGDVGTISL